MAMLPLPQNYSKDSDGFPFPIPGAVMCKFAYLDYTYESGTAVFFLPNNAEIVGWLLNVNTAFNAGATNTLDVGITGALTQFAAGLSVATAGMVTTGFATAYMGVKLAGITPVTVNYNQTSTVASAGVAYLYCNYIVR
jgi:hypothetical protein